MSQVGTFPRSMDFTPSSLSIGARTYTSTIQAEGNSTNISPGDEVRWKIPCGRANTYLNTCKSYMKFQVKNTTTIPSIYSDVDNGGYTSNLNRFKQLQKVCLDASGYALINRQSIYHSSNLLEEISSLNLLATMLCDLQISWSNRITTSAIIGMGPQGINNSYWRYWHAACTSRKGTNSILVGEHQSFFARPDTIGYNNYYAGFNFISQTHAKNFFNHDGNGSFTGWSGEINLPDPTANINIVGTSSLATGDVRDLLPNEADPLLGYTMVGPPKQDVHIPNYTLNVNGDLTAYPDYSRATNTANGANCVSMVSRLGPEIAWGTSLTITLPILSGVVGVLLDKNLPINQLSSDILFNCQLATVNESCCLSYVPTMKGWVFNTDADARIAGVGGAVVPVEYDDPQTWNYNTIPRSWDQVDYAVSSGDPITGRLVTPNYTIERAELVLNYIEISSEAQQLVDMANQGNYAISSTSYRHYSYTDPGNSTQLTYMIPARFSSAKSLLQCIRDTRTVSSPGSFSLSCRVANFWDSFQWNIGALKYPLNPIQARNINRGEYAQWSDEQQQPVLQGFPSLKNGAELFANVMASMGQGLCDLDTQCCLDYTSYNNNMADPIIELGKQRIPTDYPPVTSDIVSTDGSFYIAKAQGSKSAFLFGVDLENFSGQNNGGLNSGLNCLGLNIFCELKQMYNLNEDGTAARLPVAAIYDTFCHFDMIISISNGIMSVRM